MANGISNPKPSLEPLKDDEDLYIFGNLKRNPREEERVKESIIKDVEQRRSANRSSRPRRR